MTAAGKQGGPLSSYPMHYWPRTAEGLGEFGCGTGSGFRASEPSSVTCPDCLAGLASRDRRHRAAEAFDDEWNVQHDVTATPGATGRVGWAERLLAARTAAIETATRVRINHEVMSQVFPLIENKLGLRDAEKIIEAAFLAAGFEVEQ